MAPAFTTHDLQGHQVALPQEGQYLFLSFHRFAACPFCTLRTHELIKNYDQFRRRNIGIISIWPSSAELMREYIGDNTAPFPMVASPDKNLHKQYRVVERSFRSIGKLLANPGLLWRSLKYLPIGRKIDADLDLQPAEFLIDPHGRIVLAYYGGHFGDHLPLPELFQVAAQDKVGQPA